MVSFPILQRRGTETHNPVVRDMDTSMAHDPTIRGPMFEGGYVQTRARFTRISRKWTIHYLQMTQTNKNTVKDFEDARKAGSESFTWTNPEDSVSYTVRFMEPIQYTPQEMANWLWWEVEFVLEEV